MKVFQKISLLAGILSLFVSCQHHETVKDTVAPTVELTVLRNGTYVHHNVQLLATGTDNVGVKKIELYVDNILLKDATDRTISFSWDTKTVADGAHVLKAIVYDDENNSAEKQLPVNVMNVLMRITVPDNFRSGLSTEYAFLSDRNGAPLVTKQLKNASDIIFETPQAFTDSVFATNYVDYQDDGSGGYYNVIRIYTNPPTETPGRTEVLTVEHPEPPPAVGQFTVQINDPSLFVKTFSGAAITETSQYGSVITAKVSKSPTDLFYVMGTDAGDAYYQYFDKVSAGDNIRISSISDLKAFDHFTTLTSASADYFLATAYGRRNNVTYNLFVDEELDAIKIPYPENNFFTSYDLDVLEFYSGNSVGHHFKGISSFPTTVDKINSGVTSSNLNGNTLHYTFDNHGDVTYMNVTGVPAVYSAPLFAWQASAAPGADIIFPQIPQELQSLYNIPALSGFVFDYWYLENDKWSGEPFQEPYEISYRITPNISMTKSGRRSPDNILTRAVGDRLHSIDARSRRKQE